jgi:hypothetical protein
MQSTNNPFANNCANPFDDFMPSDNKPNPNTKVINDNSDKCSRLESELLQTKAYVKLLEDKFILLETRLNEMNKRQKKQERQEEQKRQEEHKRQEEQKRQEEHKRQEEQQKQTNSITVIPFYNNGNKFLNLLCEEISIHNELDVGLFHSANGYSILPASLYLDNIYLGDIDNLINYNIDAELQSLGQTNAKGKPRQIIGQNTIMFLRQFTNVKRLIINIGYDLRNNSEYGGHNRQLENLMYAIIDILAFKSGYNIVIKGRYAPIFHNRFLTELLKCNNYTRFEFDVDQTQINGTYSDSWKLFVINGHNGCKPVASLQAHCAKHNIEFVTNIM